MLGQRKSSIQISFAPGTQNSCSKCKWGQRNSRDLTNGFCGAYKTNTGTPWVRKIKDFENTTCGRFEEGIPEVVTIPLPGEQLCG
ncbi:MAG TPA: benzylsuccinate synthase subunit beta [Desulfotomaculum sp.]|nr:benzylsuccinate synthase subunit beta [Desulfotomaculum sp.]